MENVGQGAVAGGQLPHALGHRVQVLLGDVDLVLHLGLVLIDHLGEVAGLYRLEQVGGVPGAPVHQGGDIVGELDGGDLGALLADGH